MFAAIKMVLTWLLWLFIPLVFLYCGWQARGIRDLAMTATASQADLAELRDASRELLAATRTATEQSQATLRNSRTTASNLLPALEAAGLGDGRCDVPTEQRLRSVEDRQTYNLASGHAEDGSSPAASND